MSKLVDLNVNGEVFPALVLSDNGDTLKCVVFGLNGKAADIVTDVPKASTTDNLDSVLHWNDVSHEATPIADSVSVPVDTAAATA